MGEFANGVWLKLGSWSCAFFILALNVWLLWNQTLDWSATSGIYRPLFIAGAVLMAAGFSALLVYIVFWPHIRRIPIPPEPVAVTVEDRTAQAWAPRSYSTILVPLDHSDADRDAIANALSLAKLHHARIVLLHVEEGVTSQMFGSQSSTAEIAEGQQYLARIVESLREQNVSVQVLVRHGTRPAKEIVAAVETIQPDVVVMASHGHRGVKDLIFGTTINSVRHHIRVPLLIVSGGQHT
jgi:manganese transport protein